MKESRPDTLAADTETRLSAAADPATQIVLEVPTLTVLMHPRLDRIGEVASLVTLGSGRPITLSRSTPDFGHPGSSANGPLAEPHLSRRPWTLTPGPTPGSVVFERRDSRTALALDGTAVAERHTVPASAVERGVVVAFGRSVVLLLHRQPAVPSELPSFGLVGASSATRRLRQEIALAAATDAPVLLRGESGTGKELVARALHHHGDRHDGPLVTVNLAAIPPNLASAELFGATRGAFTGAGQARTGYFERAHGGTLFLDEVGETPEAIQPLLLRALEGGEIQPIGGAPRKVDVRLITATDADLEGLLATGRFRAPLLHRLATLEVRLPPLRERRSDLGRLLVHLLREAFEGDLDAALADRPDGLVAWLPRDLMVRWVHHPWPGNVRELRNLAHRLAIAIRAQTPLPDGWLADRLATSPTLGSDEDAQIAPGGDPEPPSEDPFAILESALDGWVQAMADGSLAPQPLALWLEEALLTAADRLEDGVAGRAARRVGLAESTYRRRWQRLANGPASAKPAEPAEANAVRTALGDLAEPLVAEAPWPEPGLSERVEQSLWRATDGRLSDAATATVLGVTVRTLRRRRADR